MKQPRAKFTLRLPPALHERLRKLAAKKKVSLNDLIVAWLTEHQ